MRQRNAKSRRECEPHFRRRLEERYGITLADRYDALSSKIRRGEASFLWRESNTRSHFLMPIDGQSVHVVYDKSRGLILTALPKNARIGIAA